MFVPYEFVLSLTHSPSMLLHKGAWGWGGAIGASGKQISEEYPRNASSCPVVA